MFMFVQFCSGLDFLLVMQSYDPMQAGVTGEKEGRGRD
jgi:hypothetical protein